MRFVYDDFELTYGELLNKANIPNIIKTIRTMAEETFRILNDMSPPVLSGLVNRAVVGFWKVVRPLNAIDVHRVPKARVGESTRGGTAPSR